MVRIGSRRNWLRHMALAVLAGVSTGCGTLLYPERRGQPAGRLDWGIVLLNGLGLLFLFIPGVIAFAIDFSNGTIYLPPEGAECQTSTSPIPKSKAKLRTVSVRRDQLTPAGIQKVILAETGLSISLNDDNVMTREIDSVEQFWDAKEQFEGHSLNRAFS
ncbi:hypothetical protein [Planctomicrobium sp. SH527]|uniref:hypothetical protein n=1 Tax=Planctomicrobium sp. SH527 TaxID=3448123 RepID=UPI003F5BE6EC